MRAYAVSQCVIGAGGAAPGGLLQLSAAPPLDPGAVELSRRDAHGERLGGAGSVSRAQPVRGPRALPVGDRAGACDLGGVGRVAPGRSGPLGGGNGGCARRVRATGGATLDGAEQDGVARGRGGGGVRDRVPGVWTGVRRRAGRRRRTRVERPLNGVQMRIEMAIAAACLTAGCYNYSPLTQPTPEPGASVSVTLTDAGSVDLARYLGPSVFVVRGRYVGTDDHGLVLSVSSVELVRGDEVAWAGERVTLPDDRIASVQVRQLSKRRSVLLVGVGITGLVATTAAFGLVGGASSGSTVGGPPGKK